MPSRTLPSFTLAVSSKRDSFSLPEYHRDRRSHVENYGPYYRDSARDLMKTIDLRGRKSIEYDQSFLLPDILEDEENESVDAKSMHSVFESTHCGRDDEHYGKAQAEGRPKRLRWLWCLFSPLLHKYPRGKVFSVKNVDFNPDFDYKA